MAGIAELALGAAPIAGGALLAAAAGNLKSPDFRGLIKQDLDLLDRIPEDQAELRERFKISIDQRIDDLITTTEKSRALREAAASYQGDWRDIVVFLCAVLFTIIWWNVKHDRPHYWLTFGVLVTATVLAGIYAFRGLWRALRTFLRKRANGART